MASNWKSWKLKRRCTIPVLCLQIAVFVTILVLTIVSESNDGFASVSDLPLWTVADHDIHRQLLWTALPAFFIALLGIVYAMIVTTTAERQPFVELFTGNTAKLTIMLDYPSYPLFYNWIVAFRNGHFHLGGAMLLHLLGSISLVPLTSNLFTAAPTHIEKMISLLQPYGIDISDLDIQTNLQIPIDLSSAIHSYGARAPRWMTSKYGFDPFGPMENSEPGNILGQTSAYHTEPACQVIDRTSLDIDSSGTDVPGVGSVNIQFSDRGCDITGLQWPVTSSRASYSYSWFQPCSGSTDPKDRIGIFAATYSPLDPDSFSNLTIISCFPTYWKTKVNLTMPFDEERTDDVVSIEKEGDPMRISSLSLRSLNANLPLYRLAGQSGGVKDDSLGNAVHSYAQKLIPGAEFQPEGYLDAMETIYTTMFAALVTTQLIRSLDAPQEFDGQLSLTTLRLYVSVPIAAVLEVLLLLMIFCTTILIIHVLRRQSILTEEPKGLLGRALLLLRSEVLGFAGDLQKDKPIVEGLIKHVKENYTVVNSHCWYGGETSTDSSRILVRNLKAKPIQNTNYRWWHRMSHLWSRRTRTDEATPEYRENDNLGIEAIVGKATNSPRREMTSTINPRPIHGKTI